MPKKKKYFKRKLFLFIIPLLLLSAGLIVFISLNFFQKNTKELEAIITDGKFKDTEKIAYFHGENIVPPLGPWPNPEKVLSAMVFDDSKWIEINLTDQKLKAWEGNQLAYEFSVSTGKKQWGTETPVGVYRIWIKLKSTLMSGGSGDTAYYLPNVQCTQFFYKGFGLHGTYWHANFGHPMSHGCVNMRNEDACALFYWTTPSIDYNKTLARASEDNLGTRVVVHGETPLE